MNRDANIFIKIVTNGLQKYIKKIPGPSRAFYMNLYEYQYSKLKYWYLLNLSYHKPTRINEELCDN